MTDRSNCTCAIPAKPPAEHHETCPVRAQVERWSVWCVHDDGRQYMMGDASETRWSRETAERVAQHMRAHEAGVFTARLCPSPTDYARENARLARLLSSSR